jgi:hypothetical protein
VSHNVGYATLADASVDAQTVSDAAGAQVAQTGADAIGSLGKLEQTAVEQVVGPTGRATATVRGTSQTFAVGALPTTDGA